MALPPLLRIRQLTIDLQILDLSGSTGSANSKPKTFE